MCEIVLDYILMARSSRYVGYDEPLHGESHIDEYLQHPLVPLSVSLRSPMKEMSHLADAIDLAKQSCRERGLSLSEDQAAAIYLYTMEIPPKPVYSTINPHLRNNDRAAATPWFPYMKLLHTALSNLPSYKGSIWRGLRTDVAKNYKKDDVICWGSFTSCTKSVSAIKAFLPISGKGTILMIESRSGKAIAEYSQYPKENEVLFLPGTKLKVMDEALDEPGITVIHLQEVDHTVNTGEFNLDVHTGVYSLSLVEKTKWSDNKNTQHYNAGKVGIRFSLTPTILVSRFNRYH